jgi:amino acid transporter
MGRLTVAAANKGYIPALFSYIGRVRSRPSPIEEVRFDAPFNAFILNFVLTAAYTLMGNFRALLTFIGLAQCEFAEHDVLFDQRNLIACTDTFFFLTVLGAVILRFRQPDLDRPFKPPIIIPILFSIVSGLVVLRGAVFAPIQLAVLAGELLIGAIIYSGQRFWLKRKLERQD